MRQGGVRLTWPATGRQKWRGRLHEIPQPDSRPCRFVFCFADPPLAPSCILLFAYSCQNAFSSPHSYHQQQPPPRISPFRTDKSVGHFPRPAQQVPNPTAIANKKTVTEPPSLPVAPVHKFPLQSAPNTATQSWVHDHLLLPSKYAAWVTSALI